ncbi:unnamed protein product [Urochloa decumbens]|uniref:Uncharacterized protein n=1 Tax=Urochloa decumbens TaxID=240449 RepID=A0ABC9ERD7_9POAL
MAPSKIIVASLLVLALLANTLQPSAAIRPQAAFKPENPAATASTTGAEVVADQAYHLELPPKHDPFPDLDINFPGIWPPAAPPAGSPSSSPAGAPTPSPFLGSSP